MNKHQGGMKKSVVCVAGHVFKTSNHPTNGNREILRN